MADLKRFNLIQIPVACLILCLWSGIALAGPVLTVVRGQDFPPYHYMADKGAETGVIIDVIRAVARQMDVGVRFRQYPWSRCLKMVERGDADAMMNLFKTEERTAYMYFSANILAYETNQFFKLKGSPVAYDGNLSALAGIRVGAIRNYSYGAAFDGAHLPNVFRLETETVLVKSLVNNRCELILGNSEVVKALASQMGYSGRVVPVFPVVSKEPLYIGFSKARGHQALSERFSNTLARLKASGEYARILKGYQFSP